MPNRLVESLSPYLRQHAENPVDWWEWGPAAFAEARRRDVPLLISVGYAACHWCHVMAHESFSDDEVARLLNAYTVPVKVDREERPDVDAVYMTATQAMTGQGGWPMTVFATPDGDPFHCGTYYPRAHFLRLVDTVAQAWRDRRDEVVAAGRRVVDALSGIRSTPAGGPLDPDLLTAAASVLHREHDGVYGGFGGAPKFPPSMVLEFLLRHHERTGDSESLAVVRHTCERMARGGMYDQLAGGFARYSVDRRWVVPHFEKMLYDNALLLRAYTHLWRVGGDVLAGRVARETATFLLADLRTGPGFASALDADTDGVEGLTYVWTPAQLVDALGADDGAWAADLLAVTEAGTFENGTSVLQLLADPDDPQRWQRVRPRLRELRAARPQPMRDDKVVAAWNGLAVTALVELARTMEAVGSEAGADPRDAALGAAAAAAAREAGEFLAGAHLIDGRLRRVSRDGKVGEAAGVLEDYGGVAEAFCALHQLTADGGWLELAGQLLDTALELFAADDGGFYDTAADAERLAVRPRDPSDNATPAGQSSLVAALVAYSALAGSPRHREAAEAALATVAPFVAQHPRFAGAAAAVGEAVAVGPPEVAVVGSGAPAEVLRLAAWRAAPGGAVALAGSPDAPGVPLLAGRPLVDGGAAAYVCRGFVCDVPVTTPEALAVRLSRH